MDNLTHSLAGALIGQAGLKRKTGLAMPALIIGANLPDVDAACFAWLDGVEHLAFRRGITHGPPALVLLPLILAAALWGWDRWQQSRGKRPPTRLPVHFGWLYALAFIGCLTHPALDLMNTYGIRLLEPFSSRWFHGDVLFIIDLWLWLGMGLAVWLSLKRERAGGEWRKPARIAIIGVVLYIGANHAISAADRMMNTSFASTISMPVPVAFWARDSVGVAGTRYYLEGKLLGDVDPALCDLDGAGASDDQIAAFLFWSRAPVIDRRDDGSLELRDARFYGPPPSGRFAVDLPARWCGVLAAR